MSHHEGAGASEGVDLAQNASDTEPLHQHGRLRTNNVDEAQAVVASVFEPHRLLPHAGAILDARMNAIETSTLTIGYLTYGLPARIELPPNDTWYHVNVALRGMSKVSRSDGSQERTAGRLSAAVLLPHHAQVIEWEADTEQLAFRLSRESLETHLCALAQKPVHEPLDLGLKIDLTSSPGRGLLRALDFVISEWDDGGMIAQNNVARRHMESLVLTGLLLAAPGNHHRLLEQPGHSPDRAVPRVREYIHDHAHELPTLPDLLAVAGVGARTLQARFRAETGLTPMQYLRRVRLEQVRAELELPSSADQTVTTVATTWGFFHLGRFSASYRDLFGELPSQTLEQGLDHRLRGAGRDFRPAPRNTAQA